MVSHCGLPIQQTSCYSVVKPSLGEQQKGGNMLNKHTNRRWTKVIVFSLVAVLSLVAPLANIG